MKVIKQKKNAEKEHKLVERQLFAPQKPYQKVQ